MDIHVLAVGTRMPAWVDAAFHEYARRLPGHCRLRLTEIPAGRRTKGADIARILAEEGRRLLAALPAGASVVALERQGRALDSAALAQRLAGWLAGGRDVALLIGGPEGLAPQCLARADECWSLSALTLAHPVVRVVLAEQMYRAWSILNHSPYHR